MDLTLPMNDDIFNMRVTVIIKYGDSYLLEYHKEENYFFSVGGRIKFGETIYQAAKREVREECGIELTNFQFLTVNENFYKAPFLEYKAAHELNFIFYTELADSVKLNMMHGLQILNKDMIEKNVIYPNLLKEIVHQGVDVIRAMTGQAEITPETTWGDLSFSLPIKWQEVKPCELNIRVSAIIRTKNGILIDGSTESENHVVIIGGRMQAFETIEQALTRELKEELSLSPLSMEFRGVGEDFFDFRSIRAHFVSFYFEVVIDESLLKPTDEIVFGYWKESKFEQAIMNLATTKTFVLNKNAKHSISYDGIITDTF